MNKANFVNILSEQLDLPKSATDKIICVFTHVLTEVLKTGESVILPNLGTFGIKLRSSRQVRNPQTGELIQINANVAPYFKPAPKLKKAVKRIS